MPELLDQRRAIGLLQAHGWKPTVGGKHAVKLERPGWRPITLPRHRGQTYDKRLTHAILKQAGLTSKELTWSSRSSSIRSERASGQRSPSYRGASPQAER